MRFSRSGRVGSKCLGRSCTTLARGEALSLNLKERLSKEREGRLEISKYKNRITPNGQSEEDQQQQSTLRDIQQAGTEGGQDML